MPAGVSFFWAVYTGTRPGFPRHQGGKGWRGRRELAPRCSATQLAARRHAPGQTRRDLNDSYHTHHTHHTSWDATVERARIHSPLWLACWLNCPDRSRSSQLHEVRDVWDVYIREVGFVPFEVRSQLFRLCNSPDVDSSWLLWSREAEASLARAHLAAVALPSRILVVMSGSLSICSMRLGGRCHGRIHHVDRADEFDVTHSGFFLNSSLAPVLRFRRSFVSVCNVLKGIKLHGVSEARVAALGHRWRAVVRLALLVLSPHLILGLIGFLLIFVGSISGLWTL